MDGNRIMIVGNILLLTSSLPAAELIQMNTGQWEIRSSTRLPDLSQSISNQATRCLTQNEVDPSSLFEQSRYCSVENKTVHGNSMRWLLDCFIPGKGKLRGHGKFSSDGDRAEGSMVLSVSGLKNDSQLLSTWSGQRLGECKSP